MPVGPILSQAFLFVSVDRSGFHCDLQQEPRLLVLGTRLENLGVAAFGDEDVRRLYVAVDDPFHMGSVESVGDLNRQAEQNFGLYGFAGNTMLQCHAVEKLHDEERMAVLLPDFIDGADIGMVESRRSLRLALEAGQGLGVSADIIGQKLEGDKSVEGDSALYTTPMPPPPNFSTTR